MCIKWMFFIEQRSYRLRNYFNCMFCAIKSFYLIWHGPVKIFSPLPPSKSWLQLHRSIFKNLFVVTSFKYTNFLKISICTLLKTFVDFVFLCIYVQCVNTECQNRREKKQKLLSNTKGCAKMAPRSNVNRLLESTQEKPIWASIPELKRNNYTSSREHKMHVWLWVMWCSEAPFVLRCQQRFQSHFVIPYSEISLTKTHKTFVREL